MTKKIFRSILLAASAVLLASLVIIMGYQYSYFCDVQENQLKDELGLAAVAVEDSGKEYLKGLESHHYRITWIAGDGTVLYDTQARAEDMENHGDREEIREALADGEGESSRYSSTLLEKNVYCAKTLEDGTVLRISVTRLTAGLLVLGMIQPILVVLAAALILSVVLASRLSRRIVEPLNELDLEHPLENDAYEELSPLLNRINRQHKEIAEQLRRLQQKKDEFTQITGSMGEGLVLLDNKRMILSINSAAQKLFGADRPCVGQDFLTIDRSHDMSLAVETALTEGHSEIRAERMGRVYQFDISRIESEGATIGAVLLAFDVTEREFAERNRREFTANVSHELKTPLQSIIGSAELIENGLVRPEDMSRFVGHIRREAAQLMTLIQDIIRLSQLDEGGQMPREQVDLLEIAEEAASDLQGAAQAGKVDITIHGDHTSMSGVRRLLYEIVYNLCDNAVKYNREGGSVDITISGDQKDAAVTVKDTGIGIPAEHQSRVFERFYRVDKSHSKASGGTGLGLSIVKHAVQYHHGKIHMQSAPGTGTTITVCFPKGEI